VTTHAPARTISPETPSGHERQRPLVRNLRTFRMVWLRELIRLKRRPIRILSGLVQPLLFLLVLGAGLKGLVASRDLPPGVSYQAFIFPGILGMSIITSSLFAAVAIIWDREFGFMHEMLVAPVSRTSLVVGKAFGGGSVAVMRGIVLLAFAPVVGVHLTLPRVIGASAALFLLAFTLTSFGIVVAGRMERMESFQMVMALLVQPMIFLSGALFPLENLPGWLAVLCRLNPATYGIDLCRRALFPHPQALRIGDWLVPVWFDVAVVLALGAAMLAIAVRSFGKIE
jgi:ABC-2 type transport system permease protein